VLNLLIKAFGLTDELVIGFDETVERRRGKRIRAKGVYRDAVRSSKSFFVKCVPRGLRRLSFNLQIGIYPLNVIGIQIFELLTTKRFSDIFSE